MPASDSLRVPVNATQRRRVKCFLFRLMMCFHMPAPGHGGMAARRQASQLCHVEQWGRAGEDRRER
jgi:hypothetical protein